MAKLKQFKPARIKDNFDNYICFDIESYFEKLDKGEH